MDKIAVGMADFKSSKTVLTNLLEAEADPQVKTLIIQEVVHKIIIKTEAVEVHFYVGERYYKQKLAIAGSRPLPTLVSTMSGAQPQTKDIARRSLFFTGTNQHLNF